MTEEEATRLVKTLKRQRPEINARAWLNGVTQTYEVLVNGGDPRGVRVWLNSPRRVLHYMAWLGAR